MTNFTPAESDSPLRVLCVTQGQWGERIADNVHRFCPTAWKVHRWAAPRALPLIVDDPEEFLPSQLPQVDLLLALGDTPGVATLVPDIVKLSGARAVIAPIDRNDSLPPGLANQLRNWLADLNVAAVFPKPFCSLTESSYNHPPITVEYDSAIIREFARVFGKPCFSASVNADKRIDRITVRRDSACGCGRHVAQGLGDCPVDQAVYQAGMLHHHYPCLASMTQDGDYNDTLMHISGHILRDAVQEEIRPYLEPTAYLRPQGKVEDP